MHWQQFPVYLELMRFDRPIGTYLLLWPALWALLLASEGMPPLSLLVIFSAGAFLMRSAGCVINDYADRHWDGEVSRTEQRPLASGRASAREALQLFALLCAAAASLLLFLKPLTALWALGALALASLYPFTKRYTHFPQVVLGAAFAWSIPMAYVELNGRVEPGTWLLFVAVVIWVVIYDTFYAMVDRADDLRVGIKSTAVLFAHYDRLITAILQLIFIAMLLWLSQLYSLGTGFYIAISIVAALFLYQQYLIAERQPQQCFKAFLNNNYVGMALAAGLLLDAIY